MAYSTIKKSNVYFNTTLYTGTGSSNSITGVGHQPDWVWLKQRSGTENHNSFDSLRGATTRLSPNRNNAEDTQAQQLTAFGTDGFTVGTDAGANQNGQTYVSWNWKAGTTSAISGGSITPTAVSINTTSGFGIYAYTGTGSAGTIAHGLGAVPDAVIIKNRDGTNSWIVWYNAFNGRTRLVLNSSNSASTNQPYAFNDAIPTSTVVNIGTDTDTNASGSDYIMYVFKNVKGYSKIGTITGNQNTDGPFIYTGFKPNFVMTKKVGASGDWLMRDPNRDFNGQWRDLYANNTNAETSPDANTESDVYSNGFKLRMSHTNHNENGATFMFMAFAKEPFVADETANGVPATAN